MKYKNYHEQKDAENIQRLREVLTTLPSFVSDFFRAKEMSMATTTRISYGYDIRIFFRFLVEKNPLFKNYKTTDFTYEDLDKISTVDIEEYKEYLKLYQREEEQGEIEARIAQLEKMLKNAEVIDDEELSSDVVSVGSKVRVYDKEFEEEVEYVIVGSAEADPMNNKISNESPVGMGLLGHKIGDEIKIETPDGEIEFTVLGINK